MPTTELDIANRALLRLGAKYIISTLSEDTDRARVCQAEMAPSRLETLRAHPWHHARRRAKLTSVVPGTLTMGAGATTVDSSVTFTLTGVADGFVAGRDEGFVLVGNSGRAIIDTVTDAVTVQATIETAFASAASLASGDWRFSPLWEFDFRYALPSDYLRSWDVQPVNLRGTATAVSWWRGLTTDVFTATLKREGDFLLSSDGPRLFVAYTADRPDLDTWDALSLSAYVALLAYRVCYAVTGSLQATKTQFDAYRAILAEARSMDGQEGTPDDSGSDLLLAVRLP